MESVIKMNKLNGFSFDRVALNPGLFRERFDANREYLMALETQGLLQNFYLEAGIVMPDLQVCPDPAAAKLHWGWEAPTCQLRGHFLGHWMSAASMIIANNGDRELKAKLDIIIDELAKCQELNGGQWIGSIPEKYMKKLERNDYIWSPQYVMHKTLLGLMHAYEYAGSQKALEILSKASDWYVDWTEAVQSTNPHAVYAGEEGGMLEVWARLYELTDDGKYLGLAKRYCEQSVFKKLLAGKDALTNTHANASVPHAQGAAKMYEVTGDKYWLEIVEKFWKCAVLDRESFCTGGQNSGEYWIPPHMLGQFMNERTQEFCTVYNMVRLADYLLRFTGDSCYADYIEKNLYNGFLAQHNRKTGTPTYFLSLIPGTKKKWGSRRHDFWCCHGTTVQAQAIYPSLCYYEDNAASRLVVSQYIPSSVDWKVGNSDVRITQNTDMKYYNSAAFFDDSDDSQMSRWLMKVSVDVSAPAEFTVSLRMPSWMESVPEISVDGDLVETSSLEAAMKSGYLDITKEWNGKSEIKIYLPAKLSYSYLPDRTDKLAVMEGPIVLAGVDCDDVGIRVPSENPEDVLFPVSEHTYDSFPWLQSTYRTKGQDKELTFIPLYDVMDEKYTVYFSKK